MVIVRERTICKNCTSKLEKKQSKFCSPECRNYYDRNNQLEKFIRGSINGLEKNDDSFSKLVRDYAVNEIAIVEGGCFSCGYNEYGKGSGWVIRAVDKTKFKYMEDNSFTLTCPKSDCLRKHTF
jgi:hypothetical protein